MKNDSSRAYCNVCKCTVTAKYSDSAIHSSSKKHSNAVKTPVPEITKFLVKKSDKNSLLKAQLALNLACHSPILNCDHLTEMLKSTINDSKTVSSLQMKRTKCYKIIKNVLGPYFHNNLIEDIGDGNYYFLMRLMTSL